jgi:hypothetical protein
MVSMGEGLGFLEKWLKSFFMSCRMSLSERSLLRMHWMEESRVVGDCKFIATVIITNSLPLSQIIANTKIFITANARIAPQNHPLLLSHNLRQNTQ